MGDYDYEDDHHQGPDTPPGLSNPEEDAGAAPGAVTPPASDPNEDTRQCPPALTKPRDQEDIIDGLTKLECMVIALSKEYISSTKYDRYDFANQLSFSRACAEMLAGFFTTKYLRAPLLVSIWPLSDDCPDNYEYGKFMLTKGQLVQDEPWEVRRFHL